jgi:metal-sulfur cluster biosynthetic enzyme
VTDQEAIIQAIRGVEHPEISCSLVDLGMVQDIQATKEGVSLKLVLPFLRIPAVVRDHMVHSLQQAVADFGVELGIQVREMTPTELQRFLRLEQENWKG